MNPEKRLLLGSIAFLLALVPLSLPAGGEKERLSAEFGRRIPKEWGEKVTGVRTRLKTDQKVLGLTFDACGSPKGKGYDAEIIDFLIKEKIPATLFISARWIDANPKIFSWLADQTLPEIGNHGLQHKPCSVNGRSVYGVTGTGSPAEVVDEIELNSRKIEQLTGRKPKFYRSGTAYYDEVSVEIAQKLGYEVAGFSVLGDQGATYSRSEVKNALLSAKPGAIVIMHMNHPEGGTAEGLKDAVPELKRRGFKFVKLSDFGLE